MLIVFINLDQAGSVAGLRRLLSGAIDNDQVTGMIVLACEENGFTPGSVDTILKQSPNRFLVESSIVLYLTGKIR